VRYVIRHQTRLAFPAPIREHHGELRMAPADDARQRRRSLRLAIEPAAHLHAYTDAFGNLVHHFDVLPPHTELVTLLETEVETTPAEPLDSTRVPAAREDAWLADALRAHPALWDLVVHCSASTPALAHPGGHREAPRRQEGTPVLEAVMAAMEWVHAVAHGGDRERAQLLIAMVRSWGVPARYVTGYLDPGYATIEGSDDPATHAWAEVLVPGAGWRGVDAVHRRLADETYVRVAVGRDQGDVAPQRGTFHGAQGREAPEVRLAIMRQYQQ